MKDLLDREIEIGDIVCGGFAWADTPVTRIGEVVELIERTQKIRVRWTHGMALPDKPTLVNANATYGGHARLVIVEKRGINV